MFGLRLRGPQLFSSRHTVLNVVSGQGQCRGNGGAVYSRYRGVVELFRRRYAVKKSLASGFGAATALVIAFGSGLASADNEFVGKTYGKAAEQIQSWGATAVISSREGSYLPTEECVIVRSRKANFLDSSGNSQGGTKFLLDLNCNDSSALRGHPGNSVATPEGKKIQMMMEDAKAYSDNYERAIAAGKTPVCLKNDNSVQYCVTVCTKTGACSEELAQALGL